MPQLKRGVLIAIEGIDGSGKSLLAQNLSKKLTSEFPVLLTKEPGGSLLGKTIRTLLQEQPIPITPKAEYLLFAADRSQHFSEVVVPNLKEKKLIISDRLADSSIVYQGYARGLDIGMINTINVWAMNDIKPDLICYVRIDASVARERLKQRKKLSTFDQEPLSFFEKLTQGFEDIYTNANNVIYLDGNHSPEILTQNAYKEVRSWIQQHNLIA